MVKRSNKESEMMKILFSTIKYMHDEIRDEMMNKFTDIYDKAEPRANDA